MSIQHNSDAKIVVAARAASASSVAYVGVWITVTILVGLVIPGGGFLISGASRLRRFRDRSPSLALLLIIASTVVAIQLLGLLSLPWTSPSVTSSPPQLVP